MSTRQFRSSEGLTRQLLLIWKGCSLLLREALAEGRGIHMKPFGTFTFEPIVSTEGNSRNLNGPKIRLRPCFIPTKQLRNLLTLPSHKEELAHHIEGSIYQQGVRISFLNPVPVASGIFYKSEFVRGAVETLLKGVVDLIHRGYNLNLDFEGIAKVTVIDRILKASFASSLASHVHAIEQKYPLKSVNSSLSALTPSEIEGNISRVHAIRNCKKESRLQKLERPDSSMLKDIKQRVEQLSDSSKDLCNIHVH